jgi:hypothetical protein
MPIINCNSTGATFVIVGNNVNCDGAPGNVFDRTLLIGSLERRQFALDSRRSSGLQTGN